MFVVPHTNDDAVKERQGTPNDVVVSHRKGVKAAGEYCGFQINEM
jgi:hypothetical protein